MHRHTSLRHPISRRDLIQEDYLVLHDLVRFGALAEDQINRRYGDPILTLLRLPLLDAGGFIEPWEVEVSGTQIFSATRSGARVAQCGLAQAKPPMQNLRHDIALVDLADYVLTHEPQSEWRTHREVSSVIRRTARRTRSRGFDDGGGHRPDGLLLTSSKVLAIELEHSAKTEDKYARICRWFASTPQVDGVRWYVDDPKIGDRVARVNRQHGFDRDIAVTIEPFPPGVALRPWHRP
jgi:hypothetical protein